MKKYGSACQREKELLEQMSHLRLRNSMWFRDLIYVLLNNNKIQSNITEISLNEKDRIKSREEVDEKSLARFNERLKRAGLPEIKSLDDIPEDFEPKDAFLAEAAAITLDYAEY